MSEDQELLDLERQMEDAARGVPAQEAEPAPEAEAPPEQPAQPEATQEPTEAAVPEPEAKEAEAEPELSDLDIMRAELEETRARMKHFESMAGRAAGAQGYIEQLKSQIAKLASQQQQEYTEETSPAPREPVPDYTKDWIRARAMKDAADAFAAQHPDIQELMPTIVQYVQAQGIQPLTSDNPLEIEKDVQRTLREAYDHADAERKAKRVEELRTRKAEQTKKAAQAKAKASVSGSGGAAAPTPKVKTPDEMTADELDAEMRRVTGGRW